LVIGLYESDGSYSNAERDKPEHGGIREIHCLAL
jgi:hypothetical protein